MAQMAQMAHQGVEWSRVEKSGAKWGEGSGEGLVRNWL